MRSSMAHNPDEKAIDAWVSRCDRLSGVGRR